MIAGASWANAAGLGVSMVLLQFSIGATNDVVDAPEDHGRVPPKPIASGLVGVTAGRVTAAATAIAGLAIAASFGVVPLTIAGAGLGCGLAYDLRLSRTAFSWLPLAVALPLVPVYAWYGAAGDLPQAIVPIVPMAMLAGAGLAIGNALVDLDADRALARPTVAVSLGRAVGWATHAALLGAVVMWFLLLRPLSGGAGALPTPIASGLTYAGAGLVTLGVALMTSGRHSAARAGWAAEATGVAALGIAWVLAATGST